MAFELSRAPREGGEGALGPAAEVDSRGSLGEALERGRVVRIGEESEVEDAAGAGEDCMRKQSLVSKGAQLLEKRGETSGESRDFENGGEGRSFEKERNGLADVVPEVGAVGFVESEELRVFGVGRCDDAIEFAGSALADFGTAFDAYTKMPGIRGKFSLKRRGGRFRLIFFGFEEELHELGAGQIHRSRAKHGGFDKFAERESVFMRAKRDDEAATRG